MNQKSGLRTIALMSIIALAALAVSGCMPAASTSNTCCEQEHVINVSGQGEATAAPDVAYVSLGIQTSSGDLQNAVDEANGIMERIQSAMTDLGIEEKDLRTQNFNVWIEEPYNDRGEPTGQRIYHVENMLRITVREIGKAGDVIGAGLDAGANQVQSLSFGIEDTSDLEAEARAAAIADAKDRAEQLADGLGVTLGTPLAVSDSYSGGTPLYREAYGMGGDMMEAAFAAPPISEGEMTISVSVSVTYTIE
ncbi:MAG: SIMPL domain-containing protein [Anaerolineae bacterium]|nr:SIMPL domain-containing protein [Anaerolineae bacterium]